eukprot:13139879-Alexandrium_andersonii.AAC.1
MLAHVLGVQARRTAPEAVEAQGLDAPINSFKRRLSVIAAVSHLGSRVWASALLSRILADIAAGSV